MKKNLLLLTGIALVSCTSLIAAAEGDSMTDRKKYWKDYKANFSRQIKKVNASIKRAESADLSPDSVTPLYNNLNIFQLNENIADLWLFVDALQTQVAALSSKS